jgi:hypothetical protein
MLANLLHQPPIEGARAAGLQDPRFDHAQQYGVEGGNLHPPQPTNLPLGLHDVARQQRFLQAARLDVGQDKPLQFLVLRPIFGGQDRRIAKGRADSVIDLFFGHALTDCKTTPSSM